MTSESGSYSVRIKNSYHDVLTLKVGMNVRVVYDTSWVQPSANVRETAEQELHLDSTVPSSVCHYHSLSDACRENHIHIHPTWESGNLDIAEALSLYTGCT